MNDETGFEARSMDLVNVLVTWDAANGVVCDRGRLYLSEGQRLSDLMNDNRAFLPIEIDKYSKWITALIQKRSIHCIEEKL